jgi:hypothetical protein
MRQRSIAWMGPIAGLAVLAFEAAAEVPGDDIFGFTTPTDVGNPGDTGFGNENDGRAGKRAGRYHALNSRYELGHTFAADWWAAVSLFTSYHRVRDVPDLADVDRFAFDGLSFEIEHRVLKRTQSNPFAIAVSVEPRWAPIDSVSGQPSHAINIAFKLFVDAVVIPDTLFWASNVIWAPQRAEDPADRSRWLSSSAILISSALAYQVSPKFFVGAEARYLGSFSSILPTQEVAHALYAGPTLLWKVTDKIAFNATLQPQVAGHSTTNPALRLDLDNFEKLQYRLKLSVALQ